MRAGREAVERWVYHTPPSPQCLMVLIHAWCDIVQINPPSSVMKNLTSSTVGYFPKTLSEMLQASRGYTYLKLPTSGTRCIVALSEYATTCFSLSYDRIELTSCCMDCIVCASR